jgi:hypothetical protein
MRVKYGRPKTKPVCPKNQYVPGMRLNIFIRRENPFKLVHKLKNGI